MRETRAAPRWHDDFATDLRYAWRTLLRSPGFSLVAVLSLALGLGANTAIFSVVDAVLLRSLPVHRPEELAFIATVGAKGTSGAPPYPCFERFRTETSPARANLGSTDSVSTYQPPANLAWTVANQVRVVHADTLSDVIGVEEQIDAMLVSERLLSNLATLFATVALGLAAIGLVGVVSYSVARRRTELAVRLALGASPARLAWEASRDALVPVLLGIVIGIPLAFVTAGLARGLLFGVTPAGADSYVLSAAVLAIVACLVTWIPARRASNMDPLVALRHE